MIFKLLYIIYTFSKNPEILKSRGRGLHFGAQVTFSATPLFSISCLHFLIAPPTELKLIWVSPLKRRTFTSGKPTEISARRPKFRQLYFLPCISTLFKVFGFFQIFHFRKRRTFSYGASFPISATFIFSRVYLHFLRFAGFENLKIRFGKMKNFKKFRFFENRESRNLEKWKIGNLEKWKIGYFVSNPSLEYIYTGLYTQWRYMIPASGARSEYELVQLMSLPWPVQPSTALVRWRRLPSIGGLSGMKAMRGSLSHGFPLRPCFITVRNDPKHGVGILSDGPAASRLRPRPS